MNLKSRPVVIIFSILTGAQVLVAGAALGDLMGKQVASFLALVVAAVQAAMTFYVQAQVTPNSKVVAQVSHGEFVAGPAAAQKDGTPVDVTYAGEHRARTPE